VAAREQLLPPAISSSTALCRELLLPSSCTSLSRLGAVSAVTGRSLWREWEVPADAAPTGSCTWLAEKEGRIVFGCSL